MKRGLVRLNVMRNYLSRRDMLELLAGTSAVLVGCGGQSVSADSGASDASSDAALADADATTCTQTPEGEIGPYFADDSEAGFDRTNITTNLDGTGAQDGIPLTLTVTVVDTENGCAPYVGAQVDIWQCNASGVYSDEASESTAADSWLRGFQLTDARGQITFQTIVPGWYGGRTNHIHLRVRSTYSEASSTTDGTNTTQLFFDQTFVDRLATSVAPYSAERTNPTTNAGDRVYSTETDGANVLVLAGDDTSGYASSITIGLPIG